MSGGPVPSHYQRIFRILMRVYPKATRDRHGAEMSAWLKEHYTATVPGRGLSGHLRFWRVVGADLARAILDARRAPRETRLDSTAHEGHPFADLAQDTRVALRSFARRPGFSAVAVLTLGLGIGAVTAVYSVAYGVLLAPLPYASPDRIVKVGKLSEARDRLYSLSGPDFTDLQERSRAFEALAATRVSSVTLLGEGDPELIRAGIVSSELFTVLSSEPEIGRRWGPLEDREGATPVAVIGYSLWQRRWGGDPSLVGRAVALNGVTTLVIGVMPADFVGPEAIGLRAVEVWLPLSALDTDAFSDRRNGFLQVLGRLRGETAYGTAEAELASLGETLSREYPGPGERVFGLRGLPTETVGDTRSVIVPLMAAVGLLLAISCVNVTHLLLVRAGERRSELALRRAMGARRGRVVRQLLTEGLMLGLAGGALGVVLAAVGVRAFVAASPVGIPRLAEVSVDVSVMAVAFLVSIATTVLVGFGPALWGAGRDLATDVRGGGARGPGRGSGRLSGALVVTETALATVLVVGAGLLINSFVRLSRVEMGFAPRGAYTITVSDPERDPAAQAAFYAQLIDRIEALPGVVAAGATVNLPLSGNRQQLRIAIEGQASPTSGELSGYSVNDQQVTSGYFEAIGLPVRLGRGFDARDGPGAAPVVVVNEALVRDFFGGANPIGSALTLLGDAFGDEPYEVVGVVADSRQQRLESPGEPELYLSFLQHPVGRMDVVARSSRESSDLLGAMRREVWALRPDLPIRRATSMDDFVEASRVTPRFYMLLVSAFAAFALLLAIVGIYGTLAYAVARRTREMGVRITLGASGRGILAMVLARGLGLVGLGLVGGLVLALVGTRVLESFVFGVSTTDPASIAAGLATVLAAATVACVIPARRAARLDPVTSLREE